MALTAAQLQEASAIATQYINDKVPDLFIKQNALYANMVQNHLQYVGGGVNLQIPIFFAENQAQGSIAGDGTQTVSLNINQQITYGTLQWKYYYWNISISLDDITKTSDTPLAIKSLITLKTAQARNSITRKLSTDFWGSASTDVTALNGFGDIFAASGTAYAGINNTDVPNWFYLSDSTSQIISYSAINNNLQQLAIRTNQHPEDGYGNELKANLMISNYYVLGQFMNSEKILQRMHNQETLKSGFEGITFNGVEWVSDADCPGSADGTAADNHLYILSADSFSLMYKYGFGGKKSPLDTQQVIPNTPVQFNVNYLAGNMVCTDRRVNCKMSALKS